MTQVSRIAVRGADGAVHWPNLPAGTGVVEVAHEYLQALLMDRLREQRIGAIELSRCLGGTPTVWRLKLKGERRLTLDDVLGLVAAVDMNLIADSPLSGQTVEDLVPPEFREWLVRDPGPLQLPRFQRPANQGGWEPAARSINRWWRAEVDLGRDWAITSDVLAHEIVCVLHGTALSPRSVTRERIGSNEIVLEWLQESISVRLGWAAQPLGAHLNSKQLLEEVALAWRVLADQAQVDAITKICVLVGPSQVRAVIGALLGTVGAPEWTTLGLTEADRLGIPSPERDLHVRAIAPDPDGHTLWCQVK